MAKVKCRYCGKLIDKEDSHAVKHGRVNWYYCNVEHSLAKTPKDTFYEEAAKIIQTTHTMFYKEMDEIAKFHTYEKMTAYIKDSRQMIEFYMSKDFSSEYAKVRYFSSILKNNLSDFIVKEQDNHIAIDHIENTYDTSNFKAKEDKGMDDLLSDLLG